MALGFLIAAPQIWDAAETENRDSDVRYIYGECLNLQLSSDRTIGACTMAIRSGELEYGETAAAFENRGRAYFKLKLYDKAVADFSEAINISTFNAGALYRRGVVFLSRKKFVQAISDFTIALGVNPNNHEYLNARAVAYKAMGKTEQALQDYDRLIQIKPKFHTAYSNRALIHKRHKNFKKAVADLTRAITLEPNNWRAYQNRGSVHEDMGNMELAIKDFEKAVKFGSRSPAVFNMLKKFGVSPSAIMISLREIIIPIKFYLVRNANMKKDGLVLTNWLTAANINSLLLPEINAIWRQAGIVWKSNGVDDYNTDDNNIPPSMATDIVSVYKGMPKKERAKKFRFLRNLASKLKKPKQFTVIIVPFLGSNIQAVGFRPHKTLFVSAWSDKSSLGKLPPEKIAAVEKKPFKKGSLAHTIASMLGRQFGVHKISCQEYCLFGNEGTRGYILSPTQIAVTRMAATIF